MVFSTASSSAALLSPHVTGAIPGGLFPKRQRLLEASSGQVLGHRKKVAARIFHPFVIGEWRDLGQEILQKKPSLHLAEFPVEIVGEITPQRSSDLLLLLLGN